MSSLDLSQQILNKINNASSKKFKTIFDIEKNSRYNLLQYAIYLTKFGVIENLPDEEYLYLIKNIDFKAYSPNTTMALIFGKFQQKKLTINPHILEAIDSAHKKTSSIIKEGGVDFELVLLQSLLNHPNIEPEAWQWLVKKSMKNKLKNDFSIKGMNTYLTQLCNAEEYEHMLYEPAKIETTLKSIEYLTSLFEAMALDKALPSQSSLDNKLTIQKI